MARQITAGILHPVVLMDTDGTPLGGTGGSVTLEAGATVSLEAQAYSAGNTHAPAVNTAAVVTLAAPPAGQHWVVAGIYWSYNATPTSGRVSMTINGVTVFTEYVTSGGPGFFPFTPPLEATDNVAVVVTLAAAGAAVTGSMNVHAWRE